MRWIGFLTALVLSFACAPVDEVPVWGTLPEFSLSDQDAQPFGTRELAGKVWIADFVFTRCPGRCPLLTREMARIQTEIKSREWDDVALVSISVDPEHDTPEQLSAYADKHGVDAELWRFLTGSREEIWSLSTDGFALAVAESDQSTGGPILHSNKFVLTDRQGRIRGYYDAMEKDDRAKLLLDVTRVRTESAATSH